MIRGSWVDATMRKHWIQRLVGLCSSHCKLPKSLRITNVKFDSLDPFASGGSADVYRATVGNDSVETSEQVVVKFLRYSKTRKAKKKKKNLWSVRTTPSLSQ